MPEPTKVFVSHEEAKRLRKWRKTLPRIPDHSDMFSPERVESARQAMADLCGIVWYEVPEP